MEKKVRFVEPDRFDAGANKDEKPSQPQRKLGRGKNGIGEPSPENVKKIADKVNKTDMNKEQKLEK